jgi:hypothetical protein
VELGLARPDLGWTTVPAQNFGASGSGLIGDATLGVAGATCDHVIVHLTNLPSIFPVGSGRPQLSGAGWELVLEGRADHPEILQELKETAEPWRDEPEGKSGGPFVRGAPGQPSSSARSRRDRSRTGRADISAGGQQPRGCRGSDAVQVHHGGPAGEDELLGVPVASVHRFSIHSARSV